MSIYIITRCLSIIYKYISIIAHYKYFNGFISRFPSSGHLSSGDAAWINFNPQAGHQFLVFFLPPYPSYRRFDFSLHPLYQLPICIRQRLLSFDFCDDGALRFEGWDGDL